MENECSKFHKWIIVVILSLFFYLCFIYKNLTNEYLLYPDIAMHYFLSFISDFRSFGSDLFLTYISDNFSGLLHFLPINLSLFLFNWCFAFAGLLSEHMGIINVLRLFSFVQIMLFSILLCKILFDGGKIRYCIISLVAVMFLFFSMDLFQGGAPRGWSTVLTVLFLYCFVSRKSDLSYIAILLLSLFIYPHILPMIFCSIVIKKKMDGRAKAFYYMALYFLIAILFLILLKYCLISYNSFFSDTLSRASYSLYKSDTFLSSNLLIFSSIDFIINYIFNSEDHSSSYVFIVSGYLLITCLNHLIFRHEFRRSHIYINIRHLLFGGILSFLILVAVGVVLNEPLSFSHLAGKQLKVILPLFLSVNVGFFLHRVFKSRVIVIIILIIFGAFYLFIFKSGCSDYSDKEELYNFIKSTPKNSMIAGDVDDLEMIPLISNRQVYLMYIWGEISADNNFHLERKRRKKFIYDLKFQKSIKDFYGALKKENIDFFVLKNDEKFFKFFNFSSDHLFWEVLELKKYHVLIIK